MFQYYTDPTQGDCVRRLNERANDELEERLKARTRTVALPGAAAGIAGQLRRTEAWEPQRLVTALHDNLAHTLTFYELKLAALQCSGMACRSLHDDDGRNRQPMQWLYVGKHCSEGQGEPSRSRSSPRRK